MKHAFIMDPYEAVKPWKDTTYFLMLAAVQRGHEVCYVNQQDLSLQHDTLLAQVTWLQVNEDHEQPFTVKAEAKIALGECDVVWLRTDPPFDRRYFYTTLLLDYLPASTQVVNRPSGVRNWNEKLAALVYPELTPTTLVSAQRDEIIAFAEQQGRITLKPIDGFGGKGIFFFEPGDDPQPIDGITHHGRQWVIAQRYLPEAREGDKRILMLNGEPLGGILRVHAEGQELNNLDMGGQAVAVDLDADDLRICQTLAPGLAEQGIFFVGIDVIGGKLIEVNVTSPTGLQELSRFHDTPYHQQIIAATETTTAT